MWRKVQGFESITIQQLMKFSVERLLIKEPQFFLITWETKDNLLHLCSFDTLTAITDSSVDETSMFTLWRKNKS